MVTHRWLSGKPKVSDLQLKPDIFLLISISKLPWVWSLPGWGSLPSLGSLKAEWLSLALYHTDLEVKSWGIWCPMRVFHAGIPASVGQRPEELELCLCGFNGAQRHSTTRAGAVQIIKIFLLNDTWSCEFVTVPEDLKQFPWDTKTRVQAGYNLLGSYPASFEG